METMNPDVLYYHPNELRGGLPILLSRAQSSPTLPLDYGWLAPELVLVEHKTLGDLSHSLRSGHLAAQLERAKDVTDSIYLVVTGVPTPWDTVKWELAELRWDGLVGVSGMWDYRLFMAALFAVLHGLQVGGPIMAPTQYITAANVLMLYEQTRRVNLGKGRPVLPKWRHTVEYDQVESYTRALPGIGYQRAAALAERYPTWASLVNALANGAIEGVAGFGPVLSQRVCNIVIEGKK